MMSWFLLIYFDVFISWILLLILINPYVLDNVIFEK